MRRLPLLGRAAVLLASVAACDSLAAVVRGRVVDTTGAPVRDARVILAYATDSVTTVSDSLGRLDLRIAFVRADAKGSLFACKQGFYPASLAYWAGPGVHNDMPLVLRVDTIPGRSSCR